MMNQVAVRHVGMTCIQKEIGDCEHKDWVDWDNDGTDLDSQNTWKYLKTDIDAKKDIFECSKCGSIWERDAVDREEKKQWI